MTNPRETQDAESGAAVYSKTILSFYNLFVLGFSNSYVWNCPTTSILAFYNEHILANHLDVGVGTGYFLDKCTFPSSPTDHALPMIALLDLNPNSLEATSKVLQRYNPVSYLGNVLEPLTIEARFESIGLNYLLHCLPGTMPGKGRVFANLKPLLIPGGIVFGTTILGQGVERNILAKGLQRLYNSTRVFSNRSDSVIGLEKILGENFSTYSLEVKGCVAFFTGRY